MGESKWGLELDTDLNTRDRSRARLRICYKGLLPCGSFSILLCGKFIYLINNSNNVGGFPILHVCCSSATFDLGICLFVWILLDLFLRSVGGDLDATTEL